jgi:hypothetical protein
MRSAYSLIVALALAAVAGSTSTASRRLSTTPAETMSDQDSVNARAAATKAFLDRIHEYVEFHNKVEKTVPPLKETADPAEIAAREAALGDALIKHRPEAKEGDIFIAEYQPFLVKTIKDDFAKRTLADRKALIVELPKGIRIAVNMKYPTTLPLATSPPNLLKALPELPKEAEYRIVARHLILRDVTGNVIVDVMRDVFPIPR